MQAPRPLKEKRALISGPAVECPVDALEFVSLFTGPVEKGKCFFTSTSPVFIDTKKGGREEGGGWGGGREEIPLAISPSELLLCFRRGHMPL